MNVRDAVAVCLEREHIVRTCAIALIVGTWLTAYNLGDVVVAGGLDQLVWVKVCLNYLTPFVVANLGLVSRQAEE